VQHNFEHSYASDSESWDSDEAVLHGTSFLALPSWLNWFTANIAYHHIHHLSARIPNYRLAECHEEFRDLFTGVRRIGLFQVREALRHILWDTESRRIISVAEYRQRAG
jgi:omega-6 fatty acid desaturase (delta-12 desaturase)